MSNLLEKAIIDATALKEAALKNAENLVIEKYSQEIKQTMSKLLEEAPEDELGIEDDLGLGDDFGLGDEEATSKIKPPGIMVTRFFTRWLTRA